MCELLNLTRTIESIILIAFLLVFLYTITEEDWLQFADLFYCSFMAVVRGAAIKQKRELVLYFYFTFIAVVRAA